MKERMQRKEPDMIASARTGVVAAWALILLLTAPATAFAQYKFNERPAERVVVAPRPLTRPQTNLIVPPISGPIVAPLSGPIVAPLSGPIVSPLRSAAPLASPLTSSPPLYRNGDSGAFAAGVATGVAIGSAIAGSSTSDAPAPPPNNAVTDCTASSSYDARARTFIADDGNLRPCP
jgi:hypothetical protein